MPSDNNPPSPSPNAHDHAADHGSHSTNSPCAQCAHFASEAQQWQTAYLQIERQLVMLQVRIDEVDTMSSLSRHGSLARPRGDPPTTGTPVFAAAKLDKCTGQFCDQGVGQGLVCDLVHRNVQTSPVRIGMTPSLSDACVSTEVLANLVGQDIQTKVQGSPLWERGLTVNQDKDEEEESPQSSELLTVIPPPTHSPSALQSLSSSSSSSWISSTQSPVLTTENHASQTACSYLATHDPFSPASDLVSGALPQTRQQQQPSVCRRKYRRRPSHAHTNDTVSRPRTVSRRIRGLPKRSKKQRPLQVRVDLSTDDELVDYSDISSSSGHDTVDAQAESDQETCRAQSLTPTRNAVLDNDPDDESSSQGVPLEFTSDSSMMSQPRPPTPPLASKRTRSSQQLQQQQAHAQISVLATPPISPSDADLRHATVESAGNASSHASTRSIAPSSTNINHVRMRHSTSSVSISISDSLLSVSNPPLVAVQGPVPESGSPLGMAAPKLGGVTTDDDEDDDTGVVGRDRKPLPLDSAPTLLSLLESPAHSFNVLTVSRGGIGATSDKGSAPGTLERAHDPVDNQQVPTLSRGTRLDIDLSRLSTITEMSGVSTGSPSVSAIPKSVQPGDLPQQQQQQQHRHAQPSLPPMAWPRPPSTTPPPPAAANGPALFPSEAASGAVPRATLVTVSPPGNTEVFPVSRSKSKSKSSKSKKRSNASSNTSASSKLGALMPRRQPTNTSTSSSTTVSDVGHARGSSLSPPSAAFGMPLEPPYSHAGATVSGQACPGKEKNKGWKAVTSFVSKVKDRVRDKVHHKSHASKNTVFVATDVPQSPPSSSRRSSLAQLVGLGSHQGGSGPLSPTTSVSGSVRAVYGPFLSSPSASQATMASTAVTSDSESMSGPASPRHASGGSSQGSLPLLVAGGSSRGTPRPNLAATVGAAMGTKIQSQHHVQTTAAVTSAAYGSHGASGAVVGRAPPHAGASASLSSATGGMIAAAAYASHLHQYQQQKQQRQQQGTSATNTNNLRPWLGPPPLTKANSAPGSPHTTTTTLAMHGTGGDGARAMHQSMSVPELYGLAHAPTPRHTATASVPIMFPKPVKALGTPKVLLADPLEPSPNMRISMVTLESQPDSTSSRTPSPSLMSLKSDVPLVTPGDAPPVPPLNTSKNDVSLPRSLHLTDVDTGDEEDVEEASDRPLQRTHRPSPNAPGDQGGVPPEVLTLDEVADQIPVDVRSIASSRISLMLPAPTSAAMAQGASNHYVHPAATAAGSA